MKPPAILVVDDNPITRKLVRVTLQQEGYVVFESEDGQSAIEQMATCPVDLILQDIQLPDMDGFELVELLRAMPRSAEIPILAFTGFLTHVDQARSLEVGFTDYLFKPLEPSRLLDVIRTYLRPAEADEEPPGRGQRVLLIDDDASQLKLLAIHLEQLGFQVLPAADSLAALEEARRALPDAIVSDVLMPGLDGFRLCEALKQDALLQRIPVVLTSSAFTEAEDLRLARSVGAHALVQRTPECREVIAALLESLNQPEAHHARMTRLESQEVVEALLACPREGPPGPPSHPVELTEEYTYRVVRQLERYASLNVTLANRLAALEARFAILTGLAESLKDTDRLESVVSELFHYALNAAGVSLGAAYLCEEDGSLTLRGSVGYDHTAEQALPHFFGHGELLHSVLAEGEPLRVPSAAVPGSAAQALLDAAQARSLVVAPLALGQERLGVLVMASRGRELEEEWLPFAKAVGNQIGQALGLARAFCDLREKEAEKKRFCREVIRAVTHDKLHLVDVGEIPAAGELVLEAPCAEPMDCRTVRHQLQRIATETGLPAEAADDLVLAVGEGTANAVKHGAEGRCAVYLTEDRLIARVSDRGHGIRSDDLPASLLLPGFSTQISLGLGYTLMLKLVDRIWLATGPDGTVVQLEKYLQPRDALQSELFAA
jgi:CheY-like chemotaxis protein/anti-sigma regulatory factor (Ser/Thr protein kinase)